MCSPKPHDTHQMRHSLLRLSLHGNPALSLSISDHPLPLNLSALWRLGVTGDGSADDPISIDEPPVVVVSDNEAPIEISDDETPSTESGQKRPPDHAAEGHASKKTGEIEGPMAALSVLVHPPAPDWHRSRQHHCIHAVLNYLPHNDNVVLSPFSLISCMAMLCRGATLGPARDQLAHYCWPSAADATVCDDSVALPALAAFVSQLARVKVCRYANILMTDHANMQEYTDDILEHFKAQPYHLEDYGKVNTEVQKITTIPKLVLPRKPDGTVLINTVHFADQWVYEFEDRLQSTPFRTPTGSIVRVDMMHQKNRLSLAKHAHFTAVHLPYKSGLGAWFVKHDTLHTHEAAYRALQNFLELEFVQHTLPQSTQDVDLTVPKFTMSSSIDLRRLFVSATSHPITSVFEPKGHLARMSTDENEFVGRFEQECILEVDQKGTKAAVYTASQAKRGGGDGRIYQYVSFTHTFYMVIHHQDTILFVAKVASPTPSQPPSQAPSHKEVQTSEEIMQYDPWKDLAHNLITPLPRGDFLLITKQHDGKKDKNGEFIESFKDTDKDGNTIQHTDKESKVYRRTYTVPLHLLLRVQMAFRNETPNGKMSVQPVYINDEGKEEPEKLVEVNQTPNEIHFPLQKEEDEEEDGWDFKDEAGNTFLQLRFAGSEENM